MSVDPVELLRALGGAAPSGATTPTRVADRTQGAFDRLLGLAAGGGIGSGVSQPVTVAPDLGLELSAEQMQRLGEAADRAEASGAKTALVALDGVLVKLDVAERSVTQRVETMSGDVIAGIDAFVDARTPGSGPSGLGAVGSGPESTSPVGVLLGLLGSAAGLNPTMARAIGLGGDGTQERTGVSRGE